MAPPASPDARVATGRTYKAEGNDAFARGELAAALRAYHYAGLYLAGLDAHVAGVAGRVPEAVAAAAKHELSLVRSNMAACYLRQERFARAVEACDQALALDASNAKATFRKAQALRLAGEVYRARDALAPARGPEFDAERQRIDAAIRAKEHTASARLRGFLC